jgi:hypothetical protein
MLDYLADPKVLGALLFVFVIVATVAVVMTYLSSRKSRTHEEAVTATSEWQPTGKIDFRCKETPKDEQAEAAFFLRVEDFRTVESISGVEHVEIRWRNATLAEAKLVVVAYQKATESEDKGYKLPKRAEPARADFARAESTRFGSVLTAPVPTPEGPRVMPVT